MPIAILMAAFAFVQPADITADSFGLGDVFGPLEDMKPIEPRFKTWVPLQVEWPEEALATMKRHRLSSKAATRCHPRQVEVETESMAVSETENATMQIDLLGDEVRNRSTSMSQPVIAGSVAWSGHPDKSAARGSDAPTDVKGQGESVGPSAMGNRSIRWLPSARREAKQQSLPY